MKIKKSKLYLVRTSIQIIVFAVVFLIGFNQYLSEKSISAFPAISTHNLCPFGGLETTFTWITSGQFLPKVHSSAMILFLIGLVVAILFGAIFCGFICPFGSVQEWVGKIGKKIFPNKFNRMIPKKVDGVLRFIRYAVLIKIIVDTAMVGKLVFEANDPYYALMNFFSGEVLPLAFIFLAITLISSLLIERPFCKYICPYGAVLGLFSRISIFKIRRSPSTCVHCKKCDTICPMNIPISEQTTIKGHHCISCYKCISGECCPIENTLTISTRSVRRDGQ